MPMASFFRLLSGVLTPGNLDVIEQDDTGRMLVQTARIPGSLDVLIEDLHTMLGFPFEPEARKFIDEMPASIKEALRSIVLFAYDHRDQVEIRLAYQPGYTFTVNLCEWGEGDGRRIINVTLEGPTPSYL